MKKVISAILVLMLCMTFTLVASAQVDLYAVGSSKRTSELYISSTTATCTSTYRDQTGKTAKVIIEQSLEKHDFLWSWSTYAGEWTKTTNGGSAALTNKVYNLPSGTYRVKTVFTVTADGSTETITVYSAEKNVG